MAPRERMDKYTVEYLWNTMGLKIIVLSEKSQTKKKSDYIIQLIQNSGKSELICSDRKENRGCREMGVVWKGQE